MVLKAQQQKKLFGQNLEKNLLKNSIRVRNFAPLNEPLNIFTFFFILTPKSPTRRDYFGVKIRKIRAIEYLTLGHL